MSPRTPCHDRRGSLSGGLGPYFVLILEPVTREDILPSPFNGVRERDRHLPVLGEGCLTDTPESRTVFRRKGCGQGKRTHSPRGGGV